MKQTRTWTKQNKTRRFEMRMTPALYDQLTRIATRRGVTRAALLEEILMAVSLGIVNLPRPVYRLSKPKTKGGDALTGHQQTDSKAGE